jgi:hypothetical protein
VQQDRSQTKQAGNHAGLLAASTERENQNTHVEPVQRKICFMSGERQCRPKLRKSVATGTRGRRALLGKLPAAQGQESKSAAGSQDRQWLWEKPSGILGAHPKIKMAKQSSDPNTRRNLTAVNQNSVRFAAGLCS